MAISDHRRAAVGGRRKRLRHFVHRLRTERSGPGRDPIAVAVGVFIGCTPLYGLHLTLGLIAAQLFRLNRFKVSLAANISNPLVMPFLVFAEVQAGAWLRVGSFHPLTREAVTAVDPWVFGLDLVIGSLALGAVLGTALGAVTYAALRSQGADPEFSALVERAAERYADSGFTAWELANAKLRFDPVYRMSITDGLLPGGGTLLDIGCGQGLMLALLVEAREAGHSRGGPSGSARWPTYMRLIGIDTRPQIARLATEALAGSGVEIVTADVCSVPLPKCSAVLLFEVLHLMPPDAQEALLASVRTSLCSDGVVLVRETDAGAGWRFTLIHVGHRLKALAGRRWHQPLAFRRGDAWLACFRQAGFRVEVFPGRATHPFDSTFFRLSLAPTSASFVSRPA